MRLSRRKFLRALTLASTVFTLGGPRLNSAQATENGDLTIGANGLYVQPWFENSFLDLREDLETAQSANKQLILIFEQTGCPYCKELHKINLMNEQIKKYMTENFIVVQLDIRGSREVTDFEGEVMEERAFAKKWQIHFTPTLSFLPKSQGDIIGKIGRDAEAFRLTGLWRPFHFETVLRFVRGGHYRDGNLQTYLNDRKKLLEKKGKSINLWN